ncbi:aromatic amino acid lyase [Pedobacter paludis]|uniref:aromatic amino acid lyase n=1 Tax=Pedobacter paludis TaxID=2203212 RepID=UPI001980C46F
MEKCRTYLNDKLKQHTDPVYNINIGFGYLQNVKLGQENLTKLQHNLLLSHACRTGEELPK